MQRGEAGHHHAGEVVHSQWEQLANHNGPTVRDIAWSMRGWRDSGYLMVYHNDGTSNMPIRFGMHPTDSTDPSTLHPTLSLSTAKLKDASPEDVEYVQKYLVGALAFVRQFPEPDPLIPDGPVYGGTFQNRMTDVFAQTLESAQIISTETGIPVADVLVDPQLTALPPARAYLGDTTFYADTGP